MTATVVPTVPAFATNDSSITNLENLSSCVSFLVGDHRPGWHAFKTATQTISSSNTWTTLNMGSAAYDSEANVGNPGILASGTVATIQTQGIYAVEGCATFVATATAFYVDVSFLLTGGGNNPHLALNATQRFGLRGNETLGTASTQVTCCTADTTPIAVYPADTIAFQARAQASSVVVATNVTGTTYNQNRFVTNFTGHWVRIGS